MLHDEPTYRCPNCQDRGILLTERVAESGTNLGTYGSPCQCSTGVAKREAWMKPNSIGRVLADSAMDNTEALRKRGAL